MKNKGDPVETSHIVQGPRVPLNQGGFSPLLSGKKMAPGHCLGRQGGILGSRSGCEEVGFLDSVYLSPHTVCGETSVFPMI